MTALYELLSNVMSKDLRWSPPLDAQGKQLPCGANYLLSGRQPMALMHRFPLLVRPAGKPFPNNITMNGPRASFHLIERAECFGSTEVAGQCVP